VAGTNPSFDAKAFKDGIRFAMKMGAPTNLSDQATFIFPKTTSYPKDTRLDREGRPLDPTVPRTEAVSRPDIQVDCAIEFPLIAGSEEIAVGRFTPTRMTITVFQEDYERIRDAKDVRVGGDLYQVAYHPPPLALFNVGFQQIVVHARDET
jgi:hypothetical protein